MPLVTLLSRDSVLRDAMRDALADDGSVAPARTWSRLLWLVRERPVTALVLDGSSLPKRLHEAEAIGELRRRFPSASMVFVSRRQPEPLTLFRLGRVGLDGLVLLSVDGLVDGLRMSLRRALSDSTSILVTRAVGFRLPPRERRLFHGAMEAVHRGWNAEELAAHVGLTRPHLSVRLRACGLPSAGHLIIWAKLLHAGRWLGDPGRSAESVSRQLEYSSGAAFRRALKHYVGMTPTEVREKGGLRPVLDCFLDACGRGDTLHLDPFVAGLRTTRGGYGEHERIRGRRRETVARVGP